MSDVEDKQKLVEQEEAAKATGETGTDNDSQQEIDSEKEAGAQSQQVDADTTASNSAEDSKLLHEKIKRMESELLNSKAQLAARKHGIKEERIAQAVRLAQLDGIDLSSDNADEQVDQALFIVSREVPEWMEGPDNTGSSGAHRRTMPGEMSKDSVRNEFRSAMKR